jgi:hypothetical protein
MSALLLSGIQSHLAIPRGKPLGLRRRFTLNGSAQLEEHLDNICTEFSDGIRAIIPQSLLEGIVLGGGYARGEGGVLETSRGDRPYNDLEFYIFVRGHPWLTKKRFAKRLSALAEELGQFAELEIEFKIDSLSMLRRRAPNLFDHDLILGHRWLLGDDRLFAGCEQHREAGNLPVSEATRLLMNRCSGLLFAREKLVPGHFRIEDADFVCRNIAKTELALGDAVLIAHGKYHWSCLERGQRLRKLRAAAELPWIQEVRKRHGEGIQFKLQPYRSSLSRAALLQQLLITNSLALRVWLWLEKRRLGVEFQCPTDYVASRIDKWPDSRHGRNCLANLNVFGPRASFFPHLWRHPRNRILNALTMLLWMRAESSTHLRHEVQRELLLRRADGLIRAYRERWRRAS